MTRQVSYQWRLGDVMAAAGMVAATDLEPHLHARGITLSSVQVWWLVTQTPDRLSLPVLSALCDIFACTPAELIKTTAQNTATPPSVGTDSAAAQDTLSPRPLRHAHRIELNTSVGAAAGPP